MEPIRLPNEKEISAAYEDGNEAVLKLFQDTFLLPYKYERKSVIG
jgi:hypothetical protein